MPAYMIEKFKLMIGCVLILLLASVGAAMHVMSHSSAGVRAVVMPFERKEKEVYIGDNFSLPPVDNDLPVYDRYTTRERSAKGLPQSYSEPRSYFYGDHVAYLTFDDGPNKANTEKILSILDREQVKATFFLTGTNVSRYPDVVRHIYQSGNAIGVHSYSHDYKKIYSSPQAYIDELLKTEESIYYVIGVRPIISRAPGGTAGHFTKAYWQAIADIGYVDIGWNALTGDADGTGKTADKAVENLRRQLAERPYLNTHLIILMHDAAGHEETVKALPRIIAMLKQQGYTFRVVTPATPPAW